jgi:hypothetical protein
MIPVAAVAVVVGIIDDDDDDEFHGRYFSFSASAYRVIFT